MSVFRPFTEADLEFAFALAVVHDPAWDRVCSRGAPNPISFGSHIAAGAEWIEVIWSADSELSRPLGMVGLWNVFENMTAEADLVLIHDCPSAESVRAEAIAHLLAMATEMGLVRVFVRHPASESYASPAGWQVDRQVVLPEACILSSGALLDVAIDSFTKELSG